MSKIAFLFAGQGSQYTGMGQELCEVSKAAKDVFNLADSIRPDTSSQCFSALTEVLSKTLNTQPDVYCVDLAAARALVEIGIVPEAVAGFSLGEVAAVTFAGGFTQEDGFRFVCRRAELMDRAASTIKSGMAAVLKLENSRVEELCREYIEVYPANYNCPGQLVVAGSECQLLAFCAAAKEAGGRTMPLAVSGGFHSPFMDVAAQGLRGGIGSYSLKNPKIPVYSNITAKPYAGEQAELEAFLTEQVVNPVRWEESIRNMISEGFDLFIEVGPGKTLTGFLKKIAPEIACYHVENKATLEAVKLKI